MTNTYNLHPIQLSILRVLLFRQHARFSELNTMHVSNDHFTFHVKRLVELGHIKKIDNNAYQLTTSGKEFANRLDVDNGEDIKIERQAKIGVLIVVTRELEGERQYLIQQRLKQPFYGMHGGVTGKIKWGEKVMDTARRELEEETGLSAKLILTGIKHKMDYSNDNDLLDDKYFYVFRGEAPEGKFIEDFEGGRNKWLTYSEIEQLDTLFDGFFETIKMIDTDEVEFTEDQYIVERF